MRTGLTKSQKITEICFDEKEPLIHIRTHNTDLKKRLLDYSSRYPAICQQTDTDPDTGCMEFVIRKGRFSFRLTAPYSEERRRAASEAAKKHSGNLTHNIQKICYNFFEKCNQCPSKSAYKGERPFNTEERR